MNRAKLKKELANISLLKDYFLHYGWSLGFWTFAEAFTRRIGMTKLSERAHTHRYGVCKSYLKTHYGNIIQNYRNRQDLSLNDKIREDDPIWVFWYQGEEYAPNPVDLCIASIRRHGGKHPVIVLDKDNFKDYVTLPDYVMTKFNEKKISFAAFSDILRIALLKEHGGIWLDSTFYMTGELQPDIYEHSFFSISHGGKRKWVISKDMWSLCFLAAGNRNDFINYCYDMLMEYWKKEDILICYLILDCIIALGFEEIRPFEQMIREVPVNNLGVFDFDEKLLNAEVDEEEYQKMMQTAYLHKLTYKANMRSENQRGVKTYFGRMTED